jgi:SAM-dependent methyltransferase
MVFMRKHEVYKNGVYDGDIGNNFYWWFDRQFPESFEIFDLDSFYPSAYFRDDHVSPVVAKNFAMALSGVYQQLTHTRLTSVLEMGCAGGWFTKELINCGLDVIATEGAKAGVDAALRRGVPSDRVIVHDLRRRLSLNRKFDIACCTEVAEHIEPPFSSLLVESLTNHADLIWFSYQRPGPDTASFHHPNEQPEKFWVNLFDFYGYGSAPIPEIFAQLLRDRARNVFYKREKYETTDWSAAFAVRYE